MNHGAEPLSATMSPFMSGTTSPVPPAGGFGGVHRQQPNNGASSSQVPTSMAMLAAMNAANSGQASPALAYANAQLAQFAQQHQHHFGNGNAHNSMQMPNSPFQINNNGGGLTHTNNASLNAAQFASLFNHSTGALPSNLNPHALSSALAEHSSQSMPNSAASSPGAQHRRLPASALGYPSGTMTGTNTPGGHSRVAASAITGKRLNWSEMICQTIAESEKGRLVIQDLFEQMCAKFPEIREWAFGNDWEGRVKNRIKSTLSIKGNLFIKVPRPSSASGKGSWWTLSQEAQDAWKEGRVASIVKSGMHSRNTSQGRSGLEGLSGLSMSTATSRANSRAPSRRGSPVSSRGPSSHHAQNANQHAQSNSQRNSQGGYVNFAQQNQAGSQQQQQDNQSNSSPSVGSQGDGHSRRQSPSSGLPASLGMSPINFPGAPSSFEGFNMANMAGLEGFEDPSAAFNTDPNVQRHGNLGDMNGTFDPSATSAPTMNDGSMMPSSTSMGMASMNMPAGALYSISPYNAFSTSATAQHLGNIATPAHMGGPQSMPFPHSSNGGMGGNNNGLSSNAENVSAQNGQASGVNSAGLSSFSTDPTFGAFAGLDLSNIDGLNNPFGSMAGGYTMLGGGVGDVNSSGIGAQPTPIPGRQGGVQGSNGGSGSGGRGTPSASSFNAAFYSGPSPADSTGSTSAFFAHTPAMQAADAAVGGGTSSTPGQSGTTAAGGTSGGSALGPVGGEGSRRKREASASMPSSDFALPPAAEGGNQTSSDDQQDVS